MNVVVSPVYTKADSTEKDRHGILGLVTSVYARLVCYIIGLSVVKPTNSSSKCIHQNDGSQ